MPGPGDRYLEGNNGRNLPHRELRYAELSPAFSRINDKPMKVQVNLLLNGEKWEFTDVLSTKVQDEVFCVEQDTPKGKMTTKFPLSTIKTIEEFQPKL